MGVTEVSEVGDSPIAATDPSYAELVAAHAPALLRLAVMLAGSRTDGEDLLQAALLRATRHADRIAAMAAPAGYLRRIVVNEHISSTRRLFRRVRTVPATPAELDDVSAPDDADVETADLRDQTWRWLATLPPAQRAVLVLRFYEDLPDAEIATILGCREATVRSHVFRALAALRTRLTSEVEE